MSFNINIYKGFSGSLQPICAVLTHDSCKTLKTLHLITITKIKNGLRLPLVDSIRLSSFFVVKIEHSLKRMNEVAGIAHLNCSNTKTYNPSYSWELRA